MLVSVNTLAAEPGYNSPSSMVWLFGYANEAMVVVEGVETMALVDTGSQISALSEGFCTEFGLRILLLGVCCISKGQGVFQYHTKDMWRSLYQVYPGIMRMCYF